MSQVTHRSCGRKRTGLTVCGVCRASTRSDTIDFDGPSRRRERQPAAHPLPGPGTRDRAASIAIVRVIGEGGMGIVFEATHLKLRQRVAVKMLLPEMLAHDVIVTRFEREARASGQLRNRHAVARDGRRRDAGRLALHGDGIPGGPRPPDRARSPRQVAVAEAVDYRPPGVRRDDRQAHQIGIVHRDLKPANLFLAKSSGGHEGSIVKVLDFGISKVQAEGDAKLTSRDSVIGTAMYMSPEQVRSSRRASTRAPTSGRSASSFSSCSPDAHRGSDRRRSSRPRS